MIGSPDLLAFTGTEGFGDDVVVVEDALPEELSVPLYPPADPWATAAQFHRDFILVAEFSEQVGPQPVLTVPDDPRVTGTFDLNHFSVRLMSVDYQASCPGPTSHYSTTCTGPRLNFSEDSRVVLGDSADGAFAYVHHLTLYDLEARGMVRPFCMAYVSSDQDKLMQYFSELSACFSRASDSLKTGNRRAFAKELQRRLQELEFKRLALQRAAELQAPAAELQAPAGEDEFVEVGDEPSELAAVEHSILDHRELLRQVTSYPNRKLKQPDFLPYDPADSLADPSGSLTPSPCPSTPSSSPPRRFERRLKPLEELSDAYFLALTLEQLHDTERRLRGARSLLHTTRLTRTLSRSTALTNFLFELWPRPELDCEEDDERDASPRARESLEVMLASPASLESFHSCVEEIPIKMAAEEEEEEEDPEVATETMTGSVSSGDSIEVLGTERSYRTQHGVYMAADAREASAGMMFDTTSRRVTPASEAGNIRRAARASARPAAARRANSEDSIEVLSTTESIFPDDLTAITEEEAEYQPSDGGGYPDASVLLRGEEEEAENQPSDGGGFPDASVLLRGEEEEAESQPSDGGGFPDASVLLRAVRGEEESVKEETVTTANGGLREEEEEELVQRRMEAPAEREESAQQRTMGNEVREEEEEEEGVMEYGKRNHGVHRQSGVEEVPTPQPGDAVDCDGCQRVPHANTAPPPSTLLLLPEVSLWPPAAPPPRLAPPPPPLRLLSVEEEASDCASITSSSEPSSLSSHKLHPGGSLHRTRAQRAGRRRRAALRALRFLKENSFSQHAVFCLLSGRPLVVVGADEGAVNKLLGALALFLPAPGPEGTDAVLPRLTAPLQVTDLVAWRLIGIHRSASTSSCSVLNSLARYGRYLAVLDLDQRTLRCPPYQGSVVNRLADPHSAIFRGSTYLQHLESCLTALAGQALLYTFTSSCHLLPPPPPPPLHHSGPNSGKEEEEDDGAAAQRTRGRSLLLERHGGFCSSEDDLRVMHFLSDLIKVRHVGSGPPILSFSYGPVHLHRNTTTAT